MILARWSLPAMAAPATADKFRPTAVALGLDDVVVAAFGAYTAPLAVVRCARGAEPVVHEFPAVDYSAHAALHRDEIRERERAGDFDASNDLWSRELTGRPLQLVAIAGQPWLVRDAGHARFDPATLELTPVPRSQVRWLVPLPGDELLAGAGAEYSVSDAFQRFQRGPATMIEGPIFRSGTSLTRNSDWIVEGSSFPAGAPATAFTDSLGRVASGTSSFHAMSAVALGDEVVIYGRDLHRSGSSRAALVTMSLARAEVTRHQPVSHDDPVRLVLVGDTVFGLGDKTIVRVATDTLTVVDAADLPPGVRLLGAGPGALVAWHKRGKALLLLDAGPWATSLPTAVTALVTALAAKPAKKRSTKPTQDEPA